MSDTLLPAKVTPPAQPKIDPFSIVKDELLQTLSLLGQNTADLKPQIDQFLQSIAPVIAAATESGDLTTLRYARDQIAGHLGRVSLGFMYKQQAVITASITTTLSLLIKIGMGALVAAA